MAPPVMNSMELSHYEHPPCVRMQRKLLWHRLWLTLAITLYLALLMSSLVH